MLNAVIENYLDSIEEREFDAPFIALLRAMGYWDIHFLHGPFEFGKDFIAKGNSEGRTAQFAFQTKAGDINSSAWSDCRAQIDMLRTDSSAHPAFDEKLPRQAVFVTTGRLTGGAALAAQRYRDHLLQEHEIGFATWDKQNLIDFISSHPGVCLEKVTDGAFLALIGHIEQNKVRERDIENYSREWLSSNRGLNQVSLEAAIIAQRLRRANCLDLSTMAALMLIRAVWFRTHGLEPPAEEALLAAQTGRQLFRHYAWHIFDECGEGLLNPLEFLRNHGSLAAHVTYPISCLRIVEILGLLYLLDSPQDTERRDALGDFLADFLDSNPGASHPLSDRWAVSLIPAALTCAQRGRTQTVRELLIRVAKWLGDRYDSDGLGLSGPACEPREEVDRLLGAPFEFVELDRRAESYIATVVLDLAAMLRLGTE